MSATNPIDTSQPTRPFLTAKKRDRILIAISVIMAIGLIISYVMGAPWFVPLTFFALALVPIIPLGTPFKESLSGGKYGFPSIGTIFETSS